MKAAGAFDWTAWIASSPLPLSFTHRPEASVADTTATTATIELSAVDRVMEQLIRQLQPWGAEKLSAVWRLDPDRAAKKMLWHVLQTQKNVQGLALQHEADKRFVANGGRISEERRTARQVDYKKRTVPMVTFPIVYPTCGDIAGLKSFAEALAGTRALLEDFINSPLQEKTARPTQAAVTSRPELGGLGTAWTLAMAASAGEGGETGGGTASKSGRVTAEAPTTNQAALRSLQAASQAASFCVFSSTAPADPPDKGPGKEPI